MSAIHWTEISVDTPLAKLSARHAGSGPAILFWHNLFLSSEQWEDVAAALAGAYHVILIHGPGHGSSGPLEKPFAMVDCGRAAFAVLDAVGIEEAIFAGCSWGGVTCLEAALDNPARVSGLAVLNSTAGGFTRDQKAFFLGVADQMRSEGFTDAVLDIVVPMNFGMTTLETRPEFVGAFREAIKTARKDSIANAIVSVLAGPQDYCLRLSELGMPVLLLWGEEDHALPMDPYLDEFSKELPDATVVTVPRAGHALPWEAPESTAGALREFLGSI